jgi:beta-glucuronidase
MWSVANEPRVCRDAASYFKEVIHHTRTLDPTRPITISIAQSPQVSFRLLSIQNH